MISDGQFLAYAIIEPSQKITGPKWHCLYLRHPNFIYNIVISKADRSDFHHKKKDLKITFLI